MHDARTPRDGNPDLASLRIDRSDAWDRDDAGNQPRRPSSQVWRAGLVVVMVLAAIAGAVAIAAPRLWAMLDRPEVTTTEITSVAPDHAETTMSSAGYVVAQRSSRVGVKLAGAVSRVLVKEGDAVKRGDVLAVLDDGYPRAVLAAARAHVAAAAARVQTAEAQLAETALQVARDRGLVRDRAMPAAELADLEAHQESLRRAVRAAQVETVAAQADLRPLVASITELTIAAPIAGVVAGKPLEAGEVALPSGKPVAEIFDPSSMVVETDVPEARLAVARPGGPCEIVLDAFPQQRFRGEVAELGHKVDRAKATVVVKVKFLDRPDGVLPDMAARISFLRQALSDDGRRASPTKLVAATAIAQRAGKPVVFVLDGDRVRAAEVAVGPAHGASVELVRGPPAGSTVIASPGPSLEDDQTVRVRPSP
jgi:RND family efflux transporter MFP subunit